MNKFEEYLSMAKISDFIHRKELEDEKKKTVCLVFAIIAAGGIFGFAGMLLGVPTFAVIYYIAGEIVSHKLKMRNLPPDTESYIKAEELDISTNEIKYKE